MRIVHVLMSGDVAGGQIVALQLARAARDAGHDVGFVSPGEGPFLERVRDEGFHAHVVPISRSFRIDGLARLVALLRRSRVELVHTHAQVAVNSLARVAGRLAGARVVSHLHIENHFRPGRLASAPLRALDNATARLCARILVVSEATRRALVAQGYPERRLEVVHNGIDADALPEPDAVARAALAVGDDAFAVAEVARLAPVKGQRELLEALARVPGAVAVLVGADLERGGAYREELERAARDLELDGRVVFAGYRADATALLAALDALVLPSFSEGLPIVVLEAMALGLPVVATPAGGTGELVVDGETGFLVPPGDVGALAVALERLARDRELGRRLGAAGRERVRTSFSLERMCGRVLEVYDELAA